MYSSRRQCYVANPIRRSCKSDARQDRFDELCDVIGEDSAEGLPLVSNGQCYSWGLHNPPSLSFLQQSQLVW
jgi:hypothetical protein